MTSDGLRWVERPEAADSQIEWHDIVEVSPPRTAAPADGLGAAGYTVCGDGGGMTSHALTGN